MIEVYVTILNAPQAIEGADGVQIDKAWRALPADRFGPMLYRLGGAARDGEVWEFSPGDYVLCREDRFPGGEPCIMAFARAGEDGSFA